MHSDPTYDVTDKFPDWMKRQIKRQERINKILRWYQDLHWGWKLGVGIALLIGAIGFTVATGGGGAGVISVLVQTAIGVGVGVGLYTVGSLMSESFTVEGLANAALNAFLITSATVFIASAVNYIKYACRSKPVSTAELKREITDFPPNNGAVIGTEKEITLQPGTYGRYGEIGTKSNFITQAGASPSTLSLPPMNNGIYIEIQVIKPIPNVIQSVVAPWAPWGGVGGGIQYVLPYPIKVLKVLGYILY